jgi:outer membrane protein assembly factor BamD (BamD/ComL family)
VKNISKKVNVSAAGRVILISGILLMLASGCRSTAAKTEGLSAMELIQRGQEASDWNDYKLAYKYYEEVGIAFPDDIGSVCEARYEMAHIHYKEKNYDLARTELDELIASYDEPGAELLPAKFKILAGIVLKQIDEKTSKNP